MLTRQMWSGLPSVLLVESSVSCRFPLFHAQNRRTFALFTKQDDLLPIASRKALLLQLSGRAPLGERELPCQSNELAPVPTRCRFWSSQCEQPLRVGKLPEVKLWTAEMRLQAAGIFHFGDLLLIRRKANRIQREGRRLVVLATWNICSDLGQSKELCK